MFGCCRSDSCGLALDSASPTSVDLSALRDASFPWDFAGRDGMKAVVNVTAELFRDVSEPFSLFTECFQLRQAVGV